jgi:hypothetical protein
VILLPLDVPVDPDAPEARELLVEELGKAPYQAAKPGLLDLIAQQLLDWFQDLIDWLGGAGAQAGQGSAPVWLLAVLVPVAIIAVLAFLVYGLPRLNRRSAVSGALFGEDDERDAAALRRAADDAAGRGDYTTAIAELFRALARGLAERALVTTHPGTTAGAFARRAAEAFPAEAEPLQASARAFDAVRYLGRPGSREQWERLAGLEARLRSARPVLETAAST